MTETTGATEAAGTAKAKGTADTAETTEAPETEKAAEAAEATEEAKAAKAAETKEGKGTAGTRRAAGASEPSPPFPRTSVPVQGSRRPALIACVVRGATAAGLGLGVLTVLVMMVWIGAPYPDDGPGGALHAAAALWLLSHGVELVRVDTLSGGPAPVGVVPLLLVALPVSLIHRAARDGLNPDTHGRRPRPSPQGAVCAVTLGYLLVAAVIAGYAAGGSPAPDVLSALGHLPLVTLAAALAGVWTARGRPWGPLPGWLPEPLRVRLARTRVAVALRAALAGTLVLAGGGALLVAAGLVWHSAAVQDMFLQLSTVWSGRLAVLLLAAALVPNASVWGAAYALGPGFALGTEATATPLGLTGDPALPPFPLVAAVPAAGPGTVWHGVCLALPLMAALVVAAFVVARAAPRFQDREVAWSIRDTAATALLAAVACGVVTAVLSAAAGGPLGTERLVDFGPLWWLTGPAAFCWITAVAVPVAVTVRIWRVLLARLAGAGTGMGMGVAGVLRSLGVRGKAWRGGRKAKARAATAAAPSAPSALSSAPSASSGAPEPKAPRGSAASRSYDFLPERPPVTATATATVRPAPTGDVGTEDSEQQQIRPDKDQKSTSEENLVAAESVAEQETESECEPESERRSGPAQAPAPPWAAPASPWPEAPGSWGGADHPAAPSAPADSAASTSSTPPGTAKTPGPEESGPGGDRRDGG